MSLDKIIALAAVRRVETPAGVKKYGQPIKSIIKKDVVEKKLDIASMKIGDTVTVDAPGGVVYKKISDTAWKMGGMTLHDDEIRKMAKRGKFVGIAKTISKATPTKVVPVVKKTEAQIELEKRRVQLVIDLPKVKKMPVGSKLMGSLGESLTKVADNSWKVSGESYLIDDETVAFSVDDFTPVGEKKKVKKESLADIIQPVKDRFLDLKTKRDIENRLKETVEGRSLLKGIRVFQQGGYVLEEFRFAIRQRQKGKKSIGIDSGQINSEDIDNIMDAIDQYPADLIPKELYRGMRIDKSAKALTLEFAKGTKLDWEISSFSSDLKVAEDFAKLPSGVSRTTKVIVKLLGNKTGLPVEKFSKEQSYYEEREWISGGKYEVVSTKIENGKLIIVVKQTHNMRGEEI